MEKVKVFYSTRKFSDFSLNACHSGLCNKRDRLRCVKEKQCLMRMPHCEEKKLFGELDWHHATVNYIDKYHRHEEKVRGKIFKQCRLVVFSIRIP